MLTEQLGDYGIYEVPRCRKRVTHEVFRVLLVRVPRSVGFSTLVYVTISVLLTVTKLEIRFGFDSVSASGTIIPAATIPAQRISKLSIARQVKPRP